MKRASRPEAMISNKEKKIPNVCNAQKHTLIGD